MQIDGLIINAEPREIITLLKKQLELGGINRFAKMFESGDDLMVCCPYHKDGQERNPSAGIRKSDGTFHCFACGETRSLPEVISHCFGHNNADYGQKWLVQNFAISEIQSRPSIEVKFTRNADIQFEEDPEYVSETELDKYRYTHPYLYERGLTDKVIEQFDLGYDKKTDSITFPVRDINGGCLFIARRSVKEKKFDIPNGITKPLYGMYEVSQQILIPRMSAIHHYPIIVPDNIYICEGLFDCLRLWCNGKFAVAGFGCLFNSYQIKQIQDLPGRTVVLALDNDDAGREATQRLRKLLTNKIIKEVVLPNNRKDIGECTDEEIQNLKEIL